MIKFSDVLKANIRYWYVIIVCTLLFFGIVFGIKYEHQGYIASNQYFVKNNEEITISDKGKISTIYEEFNTIVKNPEFTVEVLDKLSKTRPDLAKQITKKDFEQNYNVSYDKNTYLSVSFVYENKADAIYVLELASNIAAEKYINNLGNEYNFFEVYPATVKETENKNVMFAVIGLLVGFVIGEIVVTCIVAFIPYVEDQEIVKRAVDLDIIAHLDK